MRHRRQAHERLLKASEKGRQGEGTPYSRELMDELADRALRKMGSDEPMDPDDVG